ncbi:hypothetical protein, partial [Flammeovirga aprica]
MKQFISTYISNYEYPQASYKSCNYFVKVLPKQHTFEELEKVASLCVEHSIFSYDFYMKMLQNKAYENHSKTAEVQHIPVH